MQPWQIRDAALHRLRELIPRHDERCLRSIALLLCAKNCLANQLYLHATSHEHDRPWVRERSARYIKKVMLDWSDTHGLKDAAYPVRQELLEWLFATAPEILPWHGYLDGIDYRPLAERIAQTTSSSRDNNLIAARSICNLLWNLEEYHYVWGSADVELHLRGRLNFYNGATVWFDYARLARDPAFWDTLYATMGYYREKCAQTAAQFAF